MRFTDFQTLRGETREAFTIIMKDALSRVDYKRKYRLWSYEQLSNLYGTIDDWKCQGKVRVMLTGGSARLWLLEEYRLWWRADMANHDGLLFTSDARTGVEWWRGMVADRTHRDGFNLSAACNMAIELQPTFKDHFRRILKCAQRLRDTSGAMNKLGDAELLQLLGVSGCEEEY